MLRRADLAEARKEERAALGEFLAISMLQDNIREFRLEVPFGKVVCGLVVTLEPKIRDDAIGT